MTLALIAQWLGWYYGDSRVFRDVEPGAALAKSSPSSASPAGKSTLLNCMAGSTPGTAGTGAGARRGPGQLDDDGAPFSRERQASCSRSSTLPHLDAAQNVGLPLLLLACRRSASGARAGRAGGLGLAAGRRGCPRSSAAGQLQWRSPGPRVHRPAVLLADEPTAISIRTPLPLVHGRAGGSRPGPTAPPWCW